MMLYLFVKFAKPMSIEEEDAFWAKYGGFEGVGFVFKPRDEFVTPEDVGILAISVDNVLLALRLGRLSVMLQYVPEVLRAGWRLCEDDKIDRREDLLKLIKTACDDVLQKDCKCPL